MSRMSRPTKIGLVDSWFENIKVLKPEPEKQDIILAQVVHEDRSMKPYEFTQILENKKLPRTLMVEPMNSHLVVNSLPACASYLDAGTINERTTNLFNFEAGVKRHIRAKGSMWRYLMMPQIDQCFVPDFESARYAEVVCRGGNKEKLTITKYSIK